MAATKKPDPKALRIKLKMNQTDFWRPLGVTQSGGSRYESGHAPPPGCVGCEHLAPTQPTPPLKA